MEIDANTRAIGESHSKLILLGEHAVVYGKPAIAMPFPLKVRCIVEETIGHVMLNSIVYTGVVDHMPREMQGIAACMKETLNYLGKPLENLSISIDSCIPLGRGLGSSAAVAIAMVRALFAFYGKELSKEELFSLVQISETYAHGNPSGIDMVSEASDCPVWFEKGKEVLPLKSTAPLFIAVADTGRMADTRTAVDNVKKRYAANPEKVEQSLEKIDHMANKAKAALLKGDIQCLGELLNDNQQELMKLGVSDEGLNGLVQRALKAGALGAKLTGGGMGGCMLALGKNMEHAKLIAKELREYGASNSWYFSTDSDMLYGVYE